MVRGAVLAVAVLTSACSVTATSVGSPGSTSAATRPAASKPTAGTTTPGRTTPASAAQRTFDAMTPEQRVGQLLMVGLPADAGPAETAESVAKHHVGSIVIWRDNRRSAAEIAAMVAQVQARGPATNRLLVAVDQEGGSVQRLVGPGFDAIPSAIQQGQLSTGELRRQAQVWGQQLAAAGVNVNLAPVVDTVPTAEFAPRNAPIGALHRNFGFDTGSVTSHGTAFMQGMADAGLSTTLKHFPGLGRSVGNPDFAADVTDTQTTRDDPYLAPFRAGIAAGASIVMMSTATYTRIDPANMAAFSETIVTGMLRGDLKFNGVVVSDDVGKAEQVLHLTPGQRAEKFIAAGGDIVLTVYPWQIHEMTTAVLARMKINAAFKAKADAAVLRVLRLKEQRGLLG